MVWGAGHSSRWRRSIATSQGRHPTNRKLRKTARRCEASRCVVSASERNDDEWTWPSVILTAVIPHKEITDRVVRFPQFHRAPARTATSLCRKLHKTPFFNSSSKRSFQFRHSDSLYYTILSGVLLLQIPTRPYHHSSVP